MSDHIPFDIQKQIMRKLPVKSLVRFRSVSKQWKFLIDSSHFITNYHVSNPQPKHHIILSFVDPKDFQEKHVSIVDDVTFPQNKSIRTAPRPVNLFRTKKVIGSSQGLCFFYNYNGKPDVDRTAVIWNPSVRKSVVINVPNVSYYPYKTVVGFAVCPRTNDPKLVKFTFLVNTYMMEECKPWKAEVYTLSSGIWRSLSIDLPSKTVALTGDQEAIDGFIYFLSIDRHRPIVDRVTGFNYMVMSFDMMSEEFMKICTPDCFNRGMILTMSRLRESLVLLACEKQSGKNVYDVWMMEGGVTKSFKKVFSIDPPDGSVERVIGFRKSGEAILVMRNDDFNSDDDSDDDNEDSLYPLFAYDPYSKHMDNIEISGKGYSLFGNCYTETLLLLNY